MVATSATRDASNTADFTRQVKEILGVAPEVLTGSHLSVWVTATVIGPAYIGELVVGVAPLVV